MVQACSSKAETLGVRPCMLLADATALIQGEPFVVQEHDPQADLEGLEALADWCDCFSPIVAIDWCESPECLYFDLQGVTHLFGNEWALGETVRKAFRQKGYYVRVGIADTPRAAWATACYFPDAVNVVPAMELQTLMQLPLESLRLSPPQHKMLDRLGIYRIEQLARLPRQSLPSRLGDEVLQRLDRFTGDQLENISGHQFIPVFEHQWLLDQPVQQMETIQHVVHVLLERLADQLNQHGRGANRITVRFDCDGGVNREETEPMQIELGLYQASANSERFNRLAQTHLETTTLKSAVTCVTVIAESTEVLEQRQHSLLATENCADPRELADLFERLATRLGEEHVVKAVPVDDWQAEKAFEYCPVTQQNSRLMLTPGNRGDTGSDDGIDQRRQFDATRPLRMVDPPQPIDVLAGLDGMPTRIRLIQQCGNGDQQVKRSWGPERLESAWWRGSSVKRDYYRVETESAHCFWLFQQLEDGQWFLQGSFD